METQLNSPFKLREPVKKRKKRQNVNHKKIEFEGHVFDSTTELRYYQYLLSVKEENGIESIEIQPTTVVMEGYTVECKKCFGTGKIVSQTTGNLIKCSRRICIEGRVARGEMVYTPDYKITYVDGRVKYVDVKGYVGQSEEFRLKRRMFEAKVGQEVVVVILDRKKAMWVEK